MAENEEIEDQQIDTTVPEMWKLAKPSSGEGDDEENKPPAASTGAKVGKLVKMLNDIEDAEEFETKIQERDPATGESLLVWATLSQRFVLVEWLIKKAKRNAFAFKNEKKEMTVFDKWTEIKAEIREREKERLANPPEENEEEAEEEEDKPAEPTADQQVYEGLADYHEEFGNRGMCIVKTIGELGVYQGARDEEGTKVGLGQTLFPNNDCYCGEYKDNKRHGTGTYWFANDGMIYCGSWKANLRHGVGRMVYTDGGRYYGSWLNDKRCGDGRYTYPDGSSYSGDWADDQKNGRGVYTFTDGSKYIGTFDDGEFVSGEWRLAGGTRYVGSFKNGRPVGKGVYVFKKGKENAFRQEGSYVDGSWVPGSAVTTVDATPEIDIVIQQKSIPVTFTNECAGLSVEDLVRVANFGPFKQWVEQLDKEESNGALYVDQLRVSGVTTDASQSITSVRLKVVAVDASANRIKGTEGIVLKAPATKLVVVLVGGDRVLTLVEQSPAPALMNTEAVAFPTVSVSSGGAFGGRFVDTVRPALRLSGFDQSTTVALPLAIKSSVEFTNAEQRVALYIQHVHGDAIATAQSRLDAACESFGNLKVRAVRVHDVATISTDATSVVAALMIEKLMAEGKLPQATVAAQRPPTPIPPSIEARPDIEPLLEAEREKNKPKDEDE